MRILVTNDDGIHSKGLDVLVERLKKKAEVFVIVPDRERSAVSHSMSLYKPLRVKKIQENFFIVDGMPADCVRFGLLDLLKEEKIDIVVAGINKGPNLGDDVLYSGTVGAVIESTILGLPAIAVSLVARRNFHFKTAAEISCRLIDKVFQYGLPEGVYLNVNVPNLPLNQIKGFKVTRQGKRIYGKEIEKRTDPRGFIYYWLANGNAINVKDKGTDTEAVEEEQISITPLQIDITAYNYMEKIRKWKF